MTQPSPSEHHKRLKELQHHPIFKVAKNLKDKLQKNLKPDKCIHSSLFMPLQPPKRQYFANESYQLHFYKEVSTETQVTI